MWHHLEERFPTHSWTAVGGEGEGGGGSGGSGTSLGQTPWNTPGTTAALPPNGLFAGENNKIMESPELERTLKDPQNPASGLAQDNCHHQCHPVPESIAEMLLELWQAEPWAFPGEPGSVPKAIHRSRNQESSPGLATAPRSIGFVPCAKSRQQTSHPDPVAMLLVWSLEKPIKHPAAPPPAPNLSIFPPAGSWCGNAKNSSGLVSFEEYWQFGGLVQPKPQVLTQWSLKSPTTTAGAKDLAGFMEQPV